MKKTVLILLFVGFIFTEGFAKDYQTYLSTQLTATTAEQFLQAAKEGNTAFFATLQDASVLKTKDKFGNNAFHLAKNASTVQAIAAAVRRLSEKGESYYTVLATLRDQRNNAGETPLMAHINYGKTDTFHLLYEGSKLATAVRETKALNIGGALKGVAGIKGSVIARTLACDNSGRTVAQAARANQDIPGMSRIVQFFEKNASYLF